MSIFRSTINPEIAAQLKAREKVVSTTSTRDSDFLRYTTGKNGWVKMTSFVNYDSKKYNKGSLIDDKNYNGDYLAKKYVLEGGTLYNKKNSLRANVGNLDGVYGGDLNKINSDPNSNKVSEMYGLRPMPGITSVNVMNKSAYGSLREATVQFYAWDKHQLEELEILFMRTGYTVFLEWGWSEYIDHDIPTSINGVPTKTEVKNFDTLTLNPFQSNLTEDAIYKKIDNDVKATKGNYDAILGYVKNFSWQLMPNGGFQCSTTLISRGETIETLKASSNSVLTFGPPPPPLITTEAPAFAYSAFEKIFLNIIGHLNELEFLNAIVFGTSTPGSFFISGSSSADQNALIKQADEVWNDIVTKLKGGRYKQASGNWNDYKIVDQNTFNLLGEGVVKRADGKTEGTFIEYISMDAFIAIINEIFIPYNTQNTTSKLTYIVIPHVTPCLANEDSVSIDPTTCLIKNIQAGFITDQTDGFSPVVLSESNATGGGRTSLSVGGIMREFLAPSEKGIGQIGNIYISINKLLSLYRNKAGDPNGVDILGLIQDVLDACSFALGGINDFQLFSKRNIVQIIDVKYFERGAKNSKFQFDLIGLKSICRDVKINSRIFAEQSTMIGIAAGDTGTTGNLGDIYSSTQTYFNAGLKDRIVKMSYGPNTLNKTSYEDAIYENVKTLTAYIKRNVLGVEIPGQTTDLVTRVPQDNEIVNAGSLLKTLIYQLNGQDVDFKALIPFELELTLDGIGGLVVGQIFTIDKSILPKDYYNKNLGFIITGVAHTLQNNDWVTNIKTQICLLDNEKILNNYFTDKSRLKARLAARRAEEARNSYFVCALADYTLLQYLRILSGGGTDINTALLDAFTTNFSNIKTSNNFMRFITEPNILDSRKASINRYLESWYEVANDTTPPNFPSLTDFMATIADIQSFGNLLYDYNTNSRTKGFADALNGGQTLSASNLDLIWQGTIFSKVEASFSSLPIQREEFNAETNDGSGNITFRNSLGTTTEVESVDPNSPGSIFKDYYKITRVQTIGTTVITYYDKIPKQALQSLHQLFYNVIANNLNLTFANGRSYLGYADGASFKRQQFEESTGNTR